MPRILSHKMYIREEKQLRDLSPRSCGHTSQVTGSHLPGHRVTPPLPGHGSHLPSQVTGSHLPGHMVTPPKSLGHTSPPRSQGHTSPPKSRGHAAPHLAPGPPGAWPQPQLPPGHSGTWALVPEDQGAGIPSWTGSPKDHTEEVQPQGDAACKGRDAGPGGELHQGDPRRSAAPLSNQLGLGNLPLAMCMTQPKTEDTVSQCFLRTRPWPPPAGTASQASVLVVPAPGWQLPALAPGDRDGHREELPEKWPEEATGQECDWSPTNTRPCPSLDKDHHGQLAWFRATEGPGTGQPHT